MIFFFRESISDKKYFYAVECDLQILLCLLAFALKFQRGDLLAEEADTEGMGTSH